MANPNVAAVVVAPVVSKPEVKKIPKSVADAMLTAGDITKAQYDKMVAGGRVTSGEGGGDPVAEQLVAAGVSKELVKKLYDTAKEINFVLWKDAKSYQGKTVPHDFTYDNVTTEKPAELEVAVWVKHFDPTAPKKAKKS